MIPDDLEKKAQAAGWVTIAEMKPAEGIILRRDPAGGEDGCERCGFTDTVDHPIHDGQSTRQDCAQCGHFRRFSRWYGRET